MKKNRKMKKIFKIPVLLFTLILIVSSCGRNVEEDAKIIADVSDLQEKIEDAKDAKGKKKIKLYEEVAIDKQNYLDIVNYYLDNQSDYDDFIEAIEEEDEDLADIFGRYKNFKKIAKKEFKAMEDDLEEWIDDLEKLKDGESVRYPEKDAKTIADTSDLQEKMQDAKKAKGTKQIALYEEVAVELQNYLDMVNYYMEDEGAFDDLVEAMEEEDDKMAENMDDYKDWKKGAKKQVKNIEDMLEEWNEELEEMKEE